MIDSLPPASILILGALLVPLMRGRLLQAYLLALPLLNLAHQWRFLTGYLRAPNTVGAVAPSSRALASWGKRCSP